MLREEAIALLAAHELKALTKELHHMTLGEARANFSKLGAVTEREVAFVLPDGKERHAP